MSKRTAREDGATKEVDKLKELFSIADTSLKISEEQELIKILRYALVVAEKTFKLKNGKIYTIKDSLIENEPVVTSGKTTPNKTDFEIFKKVMDNKQTIVSNLKTTSKLSTPIVSSGKVIGILTFSTSKENPFKEADIKNAEALAIIIGVSITHMERNEMLKGKLKNLQLLYEISTKLSKTIELEKLLETAIQLIKDTFSFNKIAVLLKEGAFLRIKKASRGCDKEEKIKKVKINIKKGEGITGTAASSGKTVISNNVKTDKRYIGVTSETESEIAIPLKTKGKLLGVLNIESTQKDRFKDEDKKVLEAIAIEVALAIDNALLYEKTKELAKKDELTKLYNYRAFREELTKEISRALRYNKKFSLVMFDIDSFKEYNDNNGHDVGNIALKKIGRIILSSGRDLDFPARFGGEEFIIILPETGKNGAFKYAERIRKSIEKEKFPGEENQPNGKLTVSGGVAEFPTDGDTAEKIIKSVDIATYKSKGSGRNRVNMFNKTEEK